MTQNFQFCYTAPALKVVTVSLRKSLLEDSQIAPVHEEDFGEF